MPQNPTENLIRKEGKNPKAVFVFPSDIAASLWLEAALDITGEGTIPTHRFIAWDRFKEDAVRATVSGRIPVSSVLRKLYALNLAERNKTSQKPLFTSLIPADHADDGSLFAAWIARILPQLSMWEQRRKKGIERGYATKIDAEDNDISFLKTDYNKFLDENRLFEPSWQRPPLRDTGLHYYILFFEAIEDFSEYAELLLNAPFVTLIPVPQPVTTSSADTNAAEIANEKTPSLILYENTRCELREIALEIESLLAAGTPPEEIAISVPDLENIAPYLVREFKLRGIPFTYRAGETLGNLPAGRFFSLVSECVSSRFSFESLKAFLLDRLIPWNHPDIADELISFGIRNHCVASWNENGRELDVWEEAFKTPTKGAASDWRLRDWYRRLRDSCKKIAEATSFADIRKYYFAFREDFLDMEQLNPADDAVFARCLEELTALVGLESQYAAYIPQNPFSFFTSILSEKKYVPQQRSEGVHVFPYRVAAGTPFRYHFVPDASQDKATVLYRELPFLRQDKRQQLHIQEIDASAAFFLLYACSTGGTRFSFSYRTFSGYRIPHGFFTLQIPENTHESSVFDPYRAEREWYATNGIAEQFPKRIYRTQKDGCVAYLKRPAERGFSYLEAAYGSRLPQLNARIKDVQMTGSDIRVSQSDLAVFSICNARWFLGKLLGIEAEVSDAELMNERNLGLLYHDVLKNLYAKIRKEDTVFASSRLDVYRNWADTFAETAAGEHAEFRGPIAAPLISSLVRRITEGVCGILDRDAEILDGFIPDFLEDDIAFSRDGIRYYGKIDRISRRPADNLAVLIDYKSGRVPSPALYHCDEHTGTGDFQVPMYVFLAEESPESPYKGSKIEFAWFGDIRGGDYRPIINNNEEIKHGRKRGMLTRDEFEPAMNSFKEVVSVFADSLRKADFTRPAILSRAECLACDFRKICRYVYAVRPV